MNFSDSFITPMEWESAIGVRTRRWARSDHTTTWNASQGFDDCQDDSLWLPELGLNVHDKNVLLSNGCLTDKHINAWQILQNRQLSGNLGFQYSSFNGEGVLGRIPYNYGMHGVVGYRTVPDRGCEGIKRCPDRFLPESRRLCSEDWVKEAQTQLHIQYPTCYGFQDTRLSQDGGFQRICQSYHDAIQIHYIACRRHWVTTHLNSTEVFLYDSNYPGSISLELLQQVEAIYGGHKYIRPVHVYQQQGGRDCGLYAMAYALHAASNICEPIETIAFDQTKMRHHVIWCFEQKMPLSFPRLRTDAYIC